ncbi:MAG: hypothetical protein GEV07_30935, partial [Streptosporangiales bacterium]|nr:hypothetical protein [Streptosporangiales bacterium]
MTDAAGVRSVAHWARRHWLFLALFVAGAVLRVLATLAYQPALFHVDSRRYLGALENPDPGETSPLGYSFLLLGPVLHVAQDLMAAAIANHVVGLLMGVGAY